MEIGVSVARGYRSVRAIPKRCCAPWLKVDGVPVRRGGLRELVTPHAVGTVDQIGPADHNFLVRRAGPISFDRGPQVGPPHADWQSHLNKHEPHRLKGNLQAYFGRWSKLTRRSNTFWTGGPVHFPVIGGPKLDHRALARWRRCGLRRSASTKSCRVYFGKCRQPCRSDLGRRLTGCAASFGVSFP